MLRSAILALLAIEPASGFDLLRRFQQTEGYAWSARHSQIYPELARCLAEGLIEEVGAGPRRKRLYRTTERGKRLVRSWLIDTQPDRTVRSEVALRSFFTWVLEPARAEHFYRSEAAYQREHLGQLEELAARVPTDWRQSGPDMSRRLTIEHALRLTRAEIEWADWAADQVAIQGLDSLVKGQADADTESSNQTVGATSRGRPVRRPRARRPTPLRDSARSA
jgi:DNA-binding PadR family transcriptional regulator